MDANYISEDEFWDDWGVIQKSSGDLFEFENVKDRPVNNIWTILESGDGDADNISKPGHLLLRGNGGAELKKSDSRCVRQPGVFRGRAGWRTRALRRVVRT